MVSALAQLANVVVERESGLNQPARRVEGDGNRFARVQARDLVQIVNCCSYTLVGNRFEELVFAVDAIFRLGDTGQANGIACFDLSLFGGSKLLAQVELGADQRITLIALFFFRSSFDASIEFSS